jgi:hypothetical protein
MRGGFLIGGILGGAGGLVLGLIIGVALFAGAGFLMQGGTNIPYDSKHSYIAEHVSCIDSAIPGGGQLSRKLALMGPAAYSPLGLNVFTKGKTYTQSLWLFCAGNDIEATMTIWGAGDDGNTYMIELGRHDGSTMQITLFNQTFTWASRTNQGYVCLNVQVS